MLPLGASQDQSMVRQSCGFAPERKFVGPPVAATGGGARNSSSSRCRGAGLAHVLPLPLRHAAVLPRRSHADLRHQTGFQPTQTLVVDFRLGSLLRDDSGVGPPPCSRNNCILTSLPFARACTQSKKCLAVVVPHVGACPGFKKHLCSSRAPNYPCGSVPREFPCTS